MITKGEWTRGRTASTREDGDGVVIESGDRLEDSDDREITIAIVLGDGPEADANARAIEHVPIMLEVIRAWVNLHPTGFWCEHEGQKMELRCKHCLSLRSRAILRAIGEEK